MNTECSTEPLEFHALGRRTVVGRFDGGEISSDGGGLLLREVEQRTQILRRLSQCFIDHRHPTRIEHSVESLVKQRVLEIALGYAQRVYGPHGRRSGEAIRPGQAVGGQEHVEPVGVDP